ncbi:MAG TPA: toast rack family protein [Candidatus Dormibacteraeota bacterium]|nr:toast rack family protein [Candidatus Dormibacteraeota bacterium]
MTDGGVPRHRRSIGGPVVLIALGLIFLAWNFRPGADPWWIIWHYWPLILIFLGVGMIWDSFWARSHPGGDTPISGVSVAWIVLLVLFVIALWHGGAYAGGRGGSGWNRFWNSNSGDWGDWGDRNGRGDHGNSQHTSKAVELQGAKEVNVHVQMPAGQLRLDGGAGKLLDADFRYEGWQGTPQVNYTVTDGQGDLQITQNGNSSHFGNNYNDWRLNLGGAAPMDLKLEMGAGQAWVRPNGLDLSELDIHMGAGQLDLDLTKLAPSNLQADIEGGAGQARIHLPKDEGVRVFASGGIGAVNADGFGRQGDAYVNAAYGKSANNIEMTVHGGVGEIDLIEGD